MQPNNAKVSRIIDTLTDRPQFVPSPVPRVAFLILLYL